MPGSGTSMYVCVGVRKLPLLQARGSYDSEVSGPPMRLPQPPPPPPRRGPPPPPPPPLRGLQVPRAPCLSSPP